MCRHPLLTRLHLRLLLPLNLLARPPVGQRWLQLAPVSPLHVVLHSGEVLLSLPPCGLHLIGGMTSLGAEFTTCRRTLSRQNVLLYHPSDTRGRTVYYWALWQTRRGDVGPWSQVTAATVVA